MPIEFLNEENIDELVGIFRKGHSSSAWSHHPFDSRFLRKNLKEMIGNDAHFVCMYRKDDIIVGGWVASIGNFLFSKVPVGMEGGIYVEPEHRGGRIALLMYNEFVKWCKKMGAEPFVEIYFSHKEGNQKTYSFFEKLGMEECGKIFRSRAHGMP